MKVRVRAKVGTRLGVRARVIQLYARTGGKG